MRFAMYKSANILTIVSILVILTSNSQASNPTTFSNVFNNFASLDLVVEPMTCGGYDCLDFKFKISNYDYGECINSPND
jgi:hypothetical protein